MVLLRCYRISKQVGRCGCCVKRGLKDLFFQEQNMAGMRG